VTFVATNHQHILRFSIDERRCTVKRSAKWWTREMQINNLAKAIRKYTENILCLISQVPAVQVITLVYILILFSVDCVVRITQSGYLIKKHTYLHQITTFAKKHQFWCNFIMICSFLTLYGSWKKLLLLLFLKSY
jgi:hypothetical protein